MNLHARKQSFWSSYVLLMTLGAAMVLAAVMGASADSVTTTEPEVSPHRCEAGDHIL
jgi:hypothetical protein